MKYIVLISLFLTALIAFWACEDSFGVEENITKKLLDDKHKFTADSLRIIDSLNHLIDSLVQVSESFYRDSVTVSDSLRHIIDSLRKELEKPYLSRIQLNNLLPNIQQLFIRHQGMQDSAMIVWDGLNSIIRQCKAVIDTTVEPNAIWILIDIDGPRQPHQRFRDADFVSEIKVRIDSLTVERWEFLNKPTEFGRWSMIATRNANRPGVETRYTTQTGLLQMQIERVPYPHNKTLVYIRFAAEIPPFIGPVRNMFYMNLEFIY